MTTIQPKDLVEVEYNSGIYIGKAVEDRRNFMLVEILAVLQHPQQGDLHKPGQVEGIAFFERKALANKELVNAQKRKIKPYSGDVPNYAESLQKAYFELIETLSKEDTLFNKVSLQRLEDLKKHYYHKIFTELD